MRIRTVDYYDEFRCLAGACPATCCSGWQIPLDRTARETVHARGMDAAVRHGALRGKDGRCPFLEADGLCRLINEAGGAQDTISYVCRTYPRKIAEYGTLRTVSLSLSCPEAVRLFLARERLCFAESVSQEPPALNDIDAAWFRQLEQLREKTIAAAQDAEAPLRDRIAAVSKLLGAPLKGIPAQTYRRRLVHLIRRLSFMDRERREVLLSRARAPFPDHVPFEGEFGKLLAYFLDRYLLEAAEDGDAVSRGKMCILMLCLLWLMSADIHTEKEFAALLVCFSREIEHSDGNLRLLMKHAKRVLPS